MPEARKIEGQVFRFFKPQRRNSEMKLGYLLLGISFGLLVHAGYSVNHYEGLLVDRYGSSSGFSVPLDVVLEVLIALGLALFGALSTVSGSFSPIHSSGENSLNAFHKLFAPRWDFSPLKPGGVISKAPATKQLTGGEATASSTEAERKETAAAASRRSQSPSSRRS